MEFTINRTTNDQSLELNTSAKQSFDRYLIISEVLGVVIAIIGLLVIVGWAVDVPFLKSIVPGWKTTKPNTAVAYTLIGVSLWFSQCRRINQSNRRIVLICASIVSLIGFLTYAEYIFGIDLFIDNILFEEPKGAVLTSHFGRMTPTTAANIFIIGLSLILLDKKTRNGHYPYQFLMLIELVVTMMILMVYIHGISTTEYIARYLVISATSIAVFFMIFISIFFSRPDKGLMSTISSMTPGGVIARRLLIAALIVPTSLDPLIDIGQSYNLYSPSIGEALHALIITAFFSVTVFFTSKSIDIAELNRRKKEVEYKAVLHTSIDGYWCLDSAGEVVEINDAYCRLTGFSKKEMLSLNIPPGEMLDKIIVTITRILKVVDNGKFEVSQTGKDGKNIDFEVSVNHRDG